MKKIILTATAAFHDRHFKNLTAACHFPKWFSGIQPTFTL